MALPPLVVETPSCEGIGNGKPFLDKHLGKIIRFTYHRTLELHKIRLLGLPPQEEALAEEAQSQATIYYD